MRPAITWQPPYQSTMSMPPPAAIRISGMSRPRTRASSTLWRVNSSLRRAKRRTATVLGAVRLDDVDAADVLLHARCSGSASPSCTRSVCSMSRRLMRFTSSSRTGNGSSATSVSGGSSVSMMVRP